MTVLQNLAVLGVIEYDGELSVTAYIILAVVFFVIIVGLGWCLYRAITARQGIAELQSPDEIGDEGTD